MREERVHMKAEPASFDQVTLLLRVVPGAPTPTSPQPTMGVEVGLNPHPSDGNDRDEGHVSMVAFALIKEP